MLSKLKCSGGEKRVGNQMTGIQLESRNPLPLLVPEMLENILGFLPVEDLKTCRLVNKFWKDTALKPMRKKCRIIRFPHRQDVPKTKRRALEDMERFLKCFSADRGSGLLSEIRDDVLCTKFEISTNIINERTSDRHKSIAANFLKAISPWVTEIAIDVEGSNDMSLLLNRMELQELKFPSLKHITFFSTVLSLLEPKFSPRMSIFITNAPQLKKLDFDITTDHWLPSFLQVFKHNKGLKIKHLKIAAPIENRDLILLSEFGLKLKSLDLRILYYPRQPIGFLSQFLKNQSETLQSLTIDSFLSSVTGNVPFPIMKNLKSLTVHGHCLGLVNYAEQTPSLERLVFDGNINQSDWPKYLNGEMQPVPSVKELCFRWNHPSVEVLLEAVRIFPNITKVQLPADNDTVPIVYDSLPNLEELTLYISSGVGNRNIDRLLTGLTEEGCQNALIRMRHWTPDFDDSDIQLGINHTPISVLANLKLLRLKHPSSRQLEISKVSLCLALLKMPSLQILDLCERIRSPDEWMLKSVLEEFRKNRLILWKPVRER